MRTSRTSQTSSTTDVVTFNPYNDIIYLHSLLKVIVISFFIFFSNTTLLAMKLNNDSFLPISLSLILTNKHKRPSELITTIILFETKLTNFCLLRPLRMAHQQSKQTRYSIQFQIQIITKLSASLSLGYSCWLEYQIRNRIPTHDNPSSYNNHRNGFPPRNCNPLLSFSVSID